MENYVIPSYEEAVAIVRNKDGLMFYETKTIVDGFNVSIFNYRLASFNDFDTPQALEMRGLTYVFNTDGSYTTFPLMHKFWNVNQNESVLLEKLSILEIEKVELKEDGSIINFIKLPNGKIVCKSKTSFTSMQSKIGNDLINGSKDYYNFIEFMLLNNIMPIFELVSPLNRIVLNYSKTELVLLKLRDMYSGKYLDFNTHYIRKIISFYNIKTVDELSLSLDEILYNLYKTTDIEGYVVKFRNSHFVKFKTKWYCDLHGLVCSDVNNISELVKIIMDEKIDDYLSNISSQLGTEDTIYLGLLELNDFINNHIKSINDDIIKFCEPYKNMERKEFALKFKNEKLFSLYISYIYETNEAYVKKLKKLILDNNNRLERSINYMKSIGYKGFPMHIYE